MAHSMSYQKTGLSSGPNYTKKISQLEKQQVHPKL